MHEQRLRAGGGAAGTPLLQLPAGLCRTPTCPVELDLRDESAPRRLVVRRSGFRGGTRRRVLRAAVEKRRWDGRVRASRLVPRAHGFHVNRPRSANEHPPKADTDDKTRVPMLGVRSKHVLPAAPERPCIGPNGPASNSMQLCGPKPPHKQPWQPPGRAASAGHPDKRALHAPTCGAGRELVHRGFVVPHEDALQHARPNLRAHSEV